MREHRRAEIVKQRRNRLSLILREMPDNQCSSDAVFISGIGFCQMTIDRIPGIFQTAVHADFFQPLHCGGCRPRTQPWRKRTDIHGIKRTFFDHPPTF